MAKRSTPESKAANKAGCDARRKIKSQTPEFKAAKRIYESNRRTPEYKAVKNARYKMKVSTPAYKAAQIVKKSTPHHGVVTTRIIKRRAKRSTPESKAATLALRSAKQRIKRANGSFNRAAFNVYQNIRRSIPEAKAVAKLKRDMASHVCETCGRRLSGPGALKNHMAIHKRNLHRDLVEHDGRSIETKCHFQW
jgi:hypothetical protein